ncbi:hypothetical protein M5D96_001595, partial [Drosophila gunungcola]
MAICISVKQVQKRTAKRNYGTNSSTWSHLSFSTDTTPPLAPRGPIKGGRGGVANLGGECRATQPHPHP